MMHSIAQKFARAHNLNCDINDRLDGVHVKFIERDAGIGGRLFMTSTVSWLEVDRIKKGETTDVLRQWEATWSNRDRWKDAK
jgi:hypothetical protein